VRIADKMEEIIPHIKNKFRFYKEIRPKIKAAAKSGGTKKGNTHETHEV
jgi:hypothetical protein